MNENIGGLTSTTPPKQLSEVEQQFNYCNKARENLGTLIETLEDRLAPILRKISSGEAIGSKEEELTPLANEIKKFGSVMEIFSNRIKSILERLEI